MFKLNAGLLIGALMAQIAASVVIAIPVSIAPLAIGAALNDPDHILVVVTNVLGSLISNAFQAWLAIGFLRITLAVARGQRAELSMLFSGSPFFLRYIGVWILFMIGAVLGFLLFIIPMFYFLLTYWPCFYFLVDRNCGVFESFRLAGVHASGNRLNFILMYLLSMGLYILGALACGVGLIVAVPVTMMMMTICYLMMSGQRFLQPNV